MIGGYVEKGGEQAKLSFNLRKLRFKKKEV